MEETLAQKAKRLLSSVPEDKWMRGRFSDEQGRCCAIGHYTRLTSSNPNDYNTFNCNDFGRGDLRMLSLKFISETHQEEESIAGVNNYPLVNGYTEPVIKDRVMHLLDDMIQAGL